jgi:hypothetical protein
MFCLRSLTKSALVSGIALAVLCSLNASVATAQSVRGHGKIDNGPNISPSQISVDAWIDANGDVQGMMDWVGDIANNVPYTPGTGGPADPFHIEVTYLFFYGNSVYVFGIVVNSPQGASDGQGVSFTFTDNSDIGLPDEIDGQPILAGNITVND